MAGRLFVSWRSVPSGQEERGLTGQLDFELLLDVGRRRRHGAGGACCARLAVVAIRDARRAASASGSGAARLFGTRPRQTDASVSASEGVVFIEKALGHGALPVLAAVSVEVAGIAPRLAGSAIIDLARLRAALAGGAMTPARLRDGLYGRPWRCRRDSRGHSRRRHPSTAVAEAVADHIRATLCAGPLLPLADGGLALAPLDPAIAAGARDPGPRPGARRNARHPPRTRPIPRGQRAVRGPGRDRDAGNSRHERPAPDRAPRHHHRRKPPSPARGSARARRDAGIAAPPACSDARDSVRLRLARGRNQRGATGATRTQRAAQLDTRRFRLLARRRRPERRATNGSRTFRGRPADPRPPRFRLP